MKNGTDFTDRNNIRSFVEAGNTNANEISERLRIKAAVVQNYIDFLTPPAPEPEELDLDQVGINDEELPPPEEEAPKRRRRKSAA